MSSREQHHRPHLFSLSLSLPSPDLRRIPHPPFFFSSHVLSPPLEKRDRTVQHIIRTLNYPYPLSLSLSLVNMAKSWRKLDRCVTYVERALQFQGYRFVTPFR